MLTAASSARDPRDTPDGLIAHPQIGRYFERYDPRHRACVSPIPTSPLSPTVAPLVLKNEVLLCVYEFASLHARTPCVVVSAVKRLPLASGHGLGTAPVVPNRCVIVSPLGPKTCLIGTCPTKRWRGATRRTVARLQGRASGTAWRAEALLARRLAETRPGYTHGPRLQRGPLSSSLFGGTSINYQYSTTAGKGSNKPCQRAECNWGGVCVGYDSGVHATD